MPHSLGQTGNKHFTYEILINSLDKIFSFLTLFKRIFPKLGELFLNWKFHLKSLRVKLIHQNKEKKWLVTRNCFFLCFLNGTNKNYTVYEFHFIVFCCFQVKDEFHFFLSRRVHGPKFFWPHSCLQQMFQKSNRSEHLNNYNQSTFNF